VWKLTLFFFCISSEFRARIRKDIRHILHEIGAEKRKLSKKRMSLLRQLAATLEAPIKLSSDAYVASAFGVFTSLLTSYAYTSLFFFIPLGEFVFPFRFIFGAILCIVLASLEVYLSHWGQRQAVKVKRMATTLTAMNILLSSSPKNKKKHRKKRIRIIETQSKDVNDTSCKMQVVCQ